MLQATYCSSVCSVKSVGRMLVIFLCITMDTVNWSKINRNIRVKIEIMRTCELFLYVNFAKPKSRAP